MLESELERKREKRKRRFALAIGLLLALFVHALIFWGPRIHYRPVMENLRRTIIAKPYREVFQPPPPTGAPKEVEAPDEGKTAPPPSTTPVPAPLMGNSTGIESSVSQESSNAPSTRSVTSHQSVAEAPRKVEKSGGALKGEAEVAHAAGNSGQWENLMGEIASKGAEIEKKKGQEWDAPKAEPVAVNRPPPPPPERGEDEDRILDSRIRVVVNTYPPTKLQRSPLPLRYPDAVKVKKKNFKEGVCRVYYRVKTDSLGRIIKREIKTPATSEAQEHFALFVDAVRSEVEKWPFEEVEADVHVDVYFTIDID
ncbi:hypothetical protein EPN96_04340 [bacterium]|nr:MAG: hypothetical protein EPN96_04340 [bacterium]